MWRCKSGGKIAALGAMSIVSASVVGSLATAVSAKAKNDDSKFIAGREITICKNCPTFAEVPQPPAELRHIRYVSKFELTWRNYLEAVDAGTCKIPAPYRPSFDSDRIKIADEIVKNNISRYRVDWPIVMLSLDNIECYKNWLQSTQRARSHSQLKWNGSGSLAQEKGTPASLGEMRQAPNMKPW